jgi:hypothetical protein
VSEKQADGGRGEIDQLRGKLEQAHAVIAHLLTQHCPDLGAEGQRALDYFSGDRFRPDFLPWPRLASEGLRPEDLSAANDG